MIVFTNLEKKENKRWPGSFLHLCKRFTEKNRLHANKKMRIDLQQERCMLDYHFLSISQDLKRFLKEFPLSKF